MDQMGIRNNSGDVVEVLWDGQLIVFKPGQVKVFPQNLAELVSNEHKSLELVNLEEQVASEPKAPVVEPESDEDGSDDEDETNDGSDDEEDEEDRYEATLAANGRTQYRKNGKLISKEEYDRATA